MTELIQSGLPTTLPEPSFKIDILADYRDKNIAIDERGATIYANIATSGINFSHFRLDNVFVLFDTSKIPGRVAVAQNLRTTQNQWSVLGGPMTITSERKLFEFEIRTGLFSSPSFLQDRRPAMTLKDALTEFKSASRGDFTLDLQIRYVVAPVNGFRPVTKDLRDKMTFNIQPD